MKDRIEGDRITLRRLEMSDAPAIYANVRQPGVRRNTLIQFPYTIESAQQFIKTAKKNWKDGTGYHFAIEYHKTGKLIGTVGYMDIRHNHRRAEIGYWLGKRYSGQGIMTEAIRLAVQFGFRQLNLKRIQAHVLPHNPASSRILEKVGFTREGRLRSFMFRRRRWYDLYIYSILQEDWGG